MISETHVGLFRVEHYESMTCDPSTDMCCKGDTSGMRGIIPNYKMCTAMDHCNFEPKCLLAQDGCMISFAQSLMDDGFATCSEACTFLEASGPHTLPVVSFRALASNSEIALLFMLSDRIENVEHLTCVSFAWPERNCQRHLH